MPPLNTSLTNSYLFPPKKSCVWKYLLTRSITMVSSNSSFMSSNWPREDIITSSKMGSASSSIRPRLIGRKKEHEYMKYSPHHWIRRNLANNTGEALLACYYFRNTVTTGYCVPWFTWATAWKREKCISAKISFLSYQHIFILRWFTSIYIIQ